MRPLLVLLLLAGQIHADERDQVVWKRCDDLTKVAHQNLGDDRARATARQAMRECFARARADYDHLHPGALADEFDEKWSDALKCQWWKRELEREHHVDAIDPSNRGHYPNVEVHAQACDQEQTRDAFAARAAEHADDPAFVAPSVSAAMCVFEQRRKEALDGIEEEKRSARVAGVIDLQALHDLQRDVVTAEDQLKQARKRLAQIKKKRIPCSDAFVSSVANCQVLINEDGAACQDEHVHEVALVYSIGF